MTCSSHLHTNAHACALVVSPWTDHLGMRALLFLSCSFRLVVPARAARATFGIQHFCSLSNRNGSAFGISSSTMSLLWVLVSCCPWWGWRSAFYPRPGRFLPLAVAPLASLGGSPRLCQVLCGPGGFGVLVSPAFQ